MRRALRWIGLALGAIASLALVAAAVVWVRSESILRARYELPAISVHVPRDTGSVAEGRRLATVHGCLDGCHGKQGEGTLFFDEPAVARLVAPNLSAAARHYSDAQLVAMIRNGIRPDGTSMFVMPSEAFAHLTDADVGRIIAFLRTLPPLEGPGPSVSLGPIGRVGVATGQFMTAAQVIRASAAPPPPRSELGARGRQLALTACSECHGAKLAGNSTPAFVAPDLGVVAAYSPGDFTRLLRTGEPVGGRQLGLMRIRAQRNLSQLTDAEIAALYEYLHGLTHR
jgi:mono/diheme cytochrome c family protein